MTRLPAFGAPAAYLVNLVPRAETALPNRLRDINVKSYKPEELGLLAFAQPENAKALSPEAGGSRFWLDSDDRSVFREMIRDMQAGRSGTRQMSFDGHPSIWAYGSIWRETSFSVVVAPYDEVVAEAIQSEQTILGMTYTQLKVSAAIVGCVILLVVLVAFVGSRSVTDPIRRLTEAAGRIADGDLDVQVDVPTHDEIGELGRRFNEMVPGLKDRLRLRQSLSLAMEVQQNLLPSAAPQVPGLDVAGTSIYCDETGGDYYDFLDLSEIAPGELGIAVGGRERAWDRGGPADDQCPGGTAKLGGPAGVAGRSDAQDEPPSDARHTARQIHDAVLSGGRWRTPVNPLGERGARPGHALRSRDGHVRGTARRRAPAGRRGGCRLRGEPTRWPQGRADPGDRDGWNLGGAQREREALRQGGVARSHTPKCRSGPRPRS